MITKRTTFFSMFFAFLLVCIYKVDTFMPYDLKMGQEYMTRLIKLNDSDDGSCSEQTNKIHREMRLINLVLDGIVEAHSSERTYSTLVPSNSKLNSLASQFDYCTNQYILNNRTII